MLVSRTLIGSLQTDLTRRLDSERALWMIALAGNFYIFAPRITAGLAAVLLAVRNIAAAWNVRAFLVLLVSQATPPIDTVLDSQFTDRLADMFIS